MMSKRLPTSVSLFSVVLLLLVLFSSFTFGNVPQVEASPVDKPASTPAPRLKLAGHSTAAAQRGLKLSPKNSADQLNLTISLPYHNQAQLTTLLTDLTNPASPSYHHYLTSAQFAAQFGATSADLAKVQTFLQTNGLQVTSTSPDRTLLTVQGSTAQVETAFDTTINNYHSATKGDYYANAVLPSVPADVSPLILSVLGFDNEPTLTQPASTTQKAALATVKVGSGPVVGGYTPQELRNAYNITPLLNAGYDGTGQTVAVISFSEFNPANVATYVRNYALGSPAPTRIYVDSTPNLDLEFETEMDVELVNAIAPKAQVLVYESVGGSLSNKLGLYKRIATDNLATTITTSFVECNTTTGDTSFAMSAHNIFAQYAAQGQSIFAGSGDWGGFCGAYAPGSGQVPELLWPAYDPYVTAVGGTSLTLNSSGGHGREVVWNTHDATVPSITGDYSSGGGYSTVFSHPTYQVGTGTTPTLGRQIPDVSADADTNTGYSTYISYLQSGVTHTVWYSNGGTSAATPLWAGIAALNNQYALTHCLGNLGQANPSLYHIFNSSSYANDFYDITIGTNRIYTDTVSNGLWYTATVGYDMVTGIGSPNAYNLVQDINGPSLSFATADWNGDGKTDLFAIKKNNTCGQNIQLSIWSGASNFQSSFGNGNITLPLSATDNAYSFTLADYDRDGKPDLAVIHQNNTASGKIEISMLSGASNFQKYIFQNIPTPLPASSNSYVFAMADWTPSGGTPDGIPDLITIQKNNTTSHHTELSIVSGVTAQYLVAPGPLSLPETGDNYAFAVADYNKDGAPDLIITQKNGTISGKVEVSIISGRDASNILSAVPLPLPAISATLSPNYTFNMGAWSTPTGTPDLLVIQKNPSSNHTAALSVISGTTAQYLLNPTIVP
jgi:kumamolisin